MYDKHERRSVKDRWMKETKHINIHNVLHAQTHAIYNEIIIDEREMFNDEKLKAITLEITMRVAGSSLCSGHFRH